MFCCQIQTCCGCGTSCSSCGRCSTSGNDSQISYRVYRYRYEAVPMQVYYGSGYTAADVLNRMETSLQRIVDKI